MLAWLVIVDAEYKIGASDEPCHLKDDVDWQKEHHNVIQHFRKAWQPPTQPGIDVVEQQIEKWCAEAGGSGHNVPYR